VEEGEVAEETYGTGYLEERKLVKRWRAPIPQIVNTLFLFALFYVTWWIFQDPRGWLRWYTPYVGYNYTRWILIIAIWIAYIFHYYPLKRKWLETWHPVVKGLVLTGMLAVVLVVLIHGIFEGILGNLGITYFNPGKLTALPGVTDFFALEYAALACLMFAALGSWLSPAWPVCMEMWPWQKLRQPALGFTVLMFTMFIATAIFLCTMHSHFGLLYYPWQYFTCVLPPWWEGIADTVSGNFHIAWIMCCTVVVWMNETIWDKWPFKAIKRDKLRRFTSFFGVMAIAFAFCFGLYYFQDLVIGEVVRGTRREFSPDWRWLHVGEMMVFFLIPMMFITMYCGNWPHKFSTPVNWLIRTVVSFAAGWVFMSVYYHTGHLFLGVQKGLSHPQQFPMIPTIWLINFMLINHWFMDNWPGWKKVRAKEAVA